jgi:hypothetical protein
MVQVTFDTNGDSLDELEHALNMLQTAIGKKRGVMTNAPKSVLPESPKLDMPEVKTEEAEETALDTPFIKIKVTHGEEEPAEAPKAPTLNQLLSDDGLTDEDFSKMLKEQIASEPKAKKAESKQDSDGYIEIIEYTDEK